MSCNLVFIKIQSHLPMRSFGIKLLHINPQLEILPGIFLPIDFVDAQLVIIHIEENEIRRTAKKSITGRVMKNGTSIGYSIGTV